MDIKGIREALNRYHTQWSADGLPDNVPITDKTRFVELLLQARVVMAIMDGRSWEDEEYTYLEEHHLRPYFGTLMGIATTTAIDPHPTISGPSDFREQ